MDGYRFPHKTASRHVRSSSLPRGFSMDPDYGKDRAHRTTEDDYRITDDRDVLSDTEPTGSTDEISEAALTRNNIRKVVQQQTKTTDDKPSIAETADYNGIDFTPLILKRQDPRDYVDTIVEFCDEHGPAATSTMLRLAMHRFPQTAGARWWHQVPRPLRKKLLAEIRRYTPKVLLPAIGPFAQEPALPAVQTWFTQDFLGSYVYWGNRNVFTDADFDDDDIVLDDEKSDITNDWAQSQWVEEDTNVTLKNVLDVSATDEDLTQEEKDSWFERHVESGRMPDVPNSLPATYGAVPSVRPKKQVQTQTFEMKELKDAGEGFEHDTDALGDIQYIGTSYAYECIILHHGIKAIWYRDLTMNHCGDDPEAPLSTVLRIHSHAHQTPYMTVEYRAVLRRQQIRIVTARIPFSCLKDAPTVLKPDPKNIREFMRSMGFPHKQSHSAFHIRFQADSTKITLSHHRRAQNDLARAAFPDLNYIVQHIDNQYRSPDLSFDVFIPHLWKDLQTWVNELGSTYTTAIEDPLRIIRLDVVHGSVVDEKALNLDLSPLTSKLSAVNSFPSIEDWVTILSDGVSREAYYQQSQAASFADIPMKVIIQPVGNIKVKVPRQVKGDDTKETLVPYTYLVSVTDAQDLKRLIELALPPGSTVVCEFELPKAPAAQSLVGRTDEEKAEIIGAQIFDALSKAEGFTIPKMEHPDLPPAERKSKEDKKADEENYKQHMRFVNAATMMVPFFKPARTPEGRILEEAAILKVTFFQAFAKALMRRVTRQDEGIEREPNKAWRKRIIKVCKFHIDKLRLPPVMTSDASRWLGIRYDAEGALRRLSDLHFLVRLPREPVWDEKNGPAPYIYPHLPELPSCTTDQDKYIATLLAHKNQVAIPCMLAYSPDTKTSQERLKGLKKLQKSKTLANEWLASPEQPPITTDLFKTVPLLDTIRYHVLRILGGDTDDLDELLPDHELTYLVEQRDAHGRINPITKSDYQIQRNQALKSYIRIVLNFDRDQLQTFYNLDKAPFGMIFIEGCAGSGKTTVANFIASVIQDAALGPDSTDFSVSLTAPPKGIDHPVVTEYLAFNSDADEFGIDWVWPHIRRPTNAPNLEPPVRETETVEQDKHDSESTVDVQIEPERKICPGKHISLPTLPFGPTMKMINIHEIIPKVDKWLDVVRAIYDQNVQRRLTQHLQNTAFRIRSQHRDAGHLSRMIILREELDREAAQSRYSSDKHFAMWAAQVRDICKQIQDYGDIDEDGFDVDDYTTQNPTDQRSQQASPQQNDGIQDIVAAAHVFNVAPNIRRAPQCKTDNKLLIIVQRNQHAQRTVEGYLKLTNLTSSRRRTVLKVNNISTEIATIMQQYRGLDPWLVFPSADISVADQLSKSLAADQADDIELFHKRKHDGVYTLNGKVCQLLDEGHLTELKGLLDAEADPTANPDATRAKEIAKRLKEVYKKILAETDVVICTPVVASKTADHELYGPTVVIFDEAGMMPEQIACSSCNNSTTCDTGFSLAITGREELSP